MTAGSGFARFLLATVQWFSALLALFGLAGLALAATLLVTPYLNDEFHIPRFDPSMVNAASALDRVVGPSAPPGTMPAAADQYRREIESILRENPVSEVTADDLTRVVAQLPDGSRRYFVPGLRIFTSDARAYLTQQGRADQPLPAGWVETYVTDFRRTMPWEVLGYPVGYEQVAMAACTVAAMMIIVLALVLNRLVALERALHRRLSASAEYATDKDRELRLLQQRPGDESGGRRCTNCSSVPGTDDAFCIECGYRLN